MIRVILCFLVSVVVISCTGPAGPQGPMGPTGATGQDGDPAKFIVSTGTLTNNFQYDSTVGTDGVWDISFPIFDDTMMVQTWVRKGTGFMWITPKWYKADNFFVRIIKDATVDFGYEYLIVGIKPN